MNIKINQAFDPKFFPLNEYMSGKWSDSDQKELYERNLKKGKISEYGPEDIWYQVNSHGYRGDEFDFSLSNDSIVYIGCSATYGSGLPLEHTWSKILHNKICSHYGKKFKYYNLSRGGQSNDYITRMAFHAKKLKPLMIFISFTFIGRREVTEGDSVISFQPENSGRMKNKNKFRNIMLSNDEEDDVLNFQKNLNHLQEMMHDQNWTFVMPLNIDFENNERYRKFNEKIMGEWVINHPNKANTKEFLIERPSTARDLMHAGHASNLKGAKEIWEWLFDGRLPVLDQNVT